MVMTTRKANQAKAKASYRRAKMTPKHTTFYEEDLGFGGKLHLNRTRPPAGHTMSYPERRPKGLRGTNHGTAPHGASWADAAAKDKAKRAAIVAAASQPASAAAPAAAVHIPNGLSGRRISGKLITGVGAAAVGTGVLIHTKRKKKQEEAAAVGKNLINPFEEVVVFGKAYPVKDVTNVRAGSPKTHTGRGVGHGQKLHEVKHKGGGGRRVGLERYQGGHSSGRVGPFS
jgi:hypothetical protein